MLNPYEAESTKAFKKAETVFVGDFKLFKRAHIDAKQAEKWKKITLPRPLLPVTFALAQQLGYHEFPLWLPPELVRSETSNTSHARNQWHRRHTRTSPHTSNPTTGLAQATQAP